MFGACYFSLTMVAAVYTFLLRTFHPNKTVNKKSRKCKKQGIKNFLFLYYIQANCGNIAKKIQLQQMTMSKLSIIDGLMIKKTMLNRNGRKERNTIVPCYGVNDNKHRLLFIYYSHIFMSFIFHILGQAFYLL